MKALFSGDFDIDRLLLGLSIEAGVNIRADNTLLIFDEIQEVPQALTALKYFYENAPHFAVIAAGSLLGVALHQGVSFPVGKVEFLPMYPMDFGEFLLAMDEKPLRDLLQSQDWALIAAMKTNTSTACANTILSAVCPKRYKPSPTRKTCKLCARCSRICCWRMNTIFPNTLTTRAW